MNDKNKTVVVLVTSTVMVYIMCCIPVCEIWIVKKLIYRNAETKLKTQNLYY